MALTIYPNTDYDSFVSLADTEAILINNVPSSQLTEWNALTNTDKEILLRQSTLLIANKIQIPTTAEVNLQRATAYLAQYSNGKIMTANDGSTGNIKVKEIVGTVKTEYFTQGKDSNTFPEIVDLLLKNYGATSESTFAFSRG